MAQTSAEKLEHTWPAEKEKVASAPQREQLASTPQPPFSRKQSRLFKVSHRNVAESQVSQSFPLAKEEGNRSRSIETKGWVPQ